MSLKELVKKLKVYYVDVPRAIIYPNLLAKFLTGALIATYFATSWNPTQLFIGLTSFAFLIHFIWGYNAYVDKERDLKNPKKSERPLPSGKAKENPLLILLTLSFSLSAILAFLISSLYLVMTLFGLTIGWFYSYRGRKHYLPEMALFFVGSGILSFYLGFKSLGVSADISFISFLIANGIFYGTHAPIKDIIDIEADKKKGDKSLPIKSGLRKTQIVSFLGEGLYLLIILLSALYLGASYLLPLTVNILAFIFIQNSLYKNKPSLAYKGVFNVFTYLTLLIMLTVVII